MLELVAAFICLTTLLTYVNFRFIGLPPTIGVMITALMFSLLLQGLSFLGYPGLEERVQQLIGQIDFGDLLMNWMLSFLLFAGALHVNLNDLRSYRWPIGLLATFGVLIATGARCIANGQRVQTTENHHRRRVAVQRRRSTFLHRSRWWSPV